MHVFFNTIMHCIANNRVLLCGSFSVTHLHEASEGVGEVDQEEQRGEHCHQRESWEHHVQGPRAELSFEF
jgi:hypothetical protein